MVLPSKALPIMASNSIFVGRKTPSLKLIHSARVSGTFSIPSDIETGDLAVVVGGASDTSPDGFTTVSVDLTVPLNFTNATSFRTAAIIGTAYGISLMFIVLEKSRDAGRTGLSFVGADDDISHTLAIFRYCYDDFTVAAPLTLQNISYSASNVPATSAGIILSIPEEAQNTEKYVLNIAGAWATASTVSINSSNMTTISGSAQNSTMVYQIYEPDEKPFGFNCNIPDVGNQLAAQIQFLITIP
jgi:hypothetical protein